MRALAISTAIVATWLGAASAYAVPRVLTLAADGSATEEGAVSGTKPASELLEGCAGFISEEPDFEVSLDVQRPSLRLRAEGPASTDRPIPSDLVLVVQLPDGSYQCNDDAAGGEDFHPQIDITNPAIGTYRVWVGSFATPKFSFTVSSPPPES